MDSLRSLLWTCAIRPAPINKWVAHKPTVERGHRIQSTKIRTRASATRHRGARNFAAHSKQTEVEEESDDLSPTQFYPFYLAKILHNQ